jgi:hypothetical protein
MPAIGATAQSKSFLRQGPIWVCSLTLEGAPTLWRCLGQAKGTSKVRHLRVQARSAAYKILSDLRASAGAYTFLKAIAARPIPIKSGFARNPVRGRSFNVAQRSEPFFNLSRFFLGIIATGCRRLQVFLLIIVNDRMRLKILRLEQI